MAPSDSAEVRSPTARTTCHGLSAEDCMIERKNSGRLLYAVPRDTSTTGLPDVGGTHFPWNARSVRQGPTKLQSSKVSPAYWNERGIVTIRPAADFPVIKAPTSVIPWLRR